MRAKQGNRFSNWRTRNGLIVGLVTAMVGLSAAAGWVPAQAAPGAYGTPQSPLVVWQEDFQSKPAPTNLNTPLDISKYSYTDTTGAVVNYSADPDWSAGAGNCNGWTLNFNSDQPTPADNCYGVPPAQVANGGADGAGNGHTAWFYLQRMAVLLGWMNGMGQASLDNNAVASQTNGGIGSQPAGYQFEATNLVKTIPGHYYAVATDFVEAHCPNDPGGKPGWNGSLEVLYLTVDGTDHAMTPAAGTDICTAGTQIKATPTTTGININWGTAPNSTSYTYFHYLHLVSAPVQATTSQTLGMKIYNASAQYSGNDVAFDNPAIIDVTPQVDKAFAPSTVPAGAPSTLTFTVTNTNELNPKTGWSFTDTLPAGVTVVPGTTATNCRNGSVTPSADGKSVTVAGDLAGTNLTSCTASVQVVSSTVGVYDNTGQNFSSNGVWPPDDNPGGPGTSTLNVVSNPALTLTKSASPTTVTAANTPVSYTFVVTNTGDVPLSGLAITDAGPNGHGYASPITCTPTSLGGTLPVGAVTNCAATYVTTTADINAATDLVNSATASGLGLGQTTPTTTGPADATVSVTSAPSLLLTKSVTPNDNVTAGTVLTYQFSVTNTGNQTVTGLHIDETAFTGTGVMSTITCPVDTLAPGAQTLCTANYTVTLADEAEGDITNTAVATGVDPSNQPVDSSPSTVSVPEAFTAAITLAKTHLPVVGTPTANPATAVTFLLTVTNSGTTPVHGVSVSDAGIGGDVALSVNCPGTGFSWPGPVGTLQPGQTVTCDAVYDLTQADIDAGSIHNSAVADATDIHSNPVLQATADDTVLLTQSPKLSLVKSVSPATVSAPGDVAYSFLVTNDGNVTLTGFTIAETAFSGSNGAPSATCPVSTLAPGASTTCTATYAVSQDDINAGVVNNTATVSGLDPSGETVVSAPSSAQVTATQSPALSLVKSVSPATVSVPGDVAYSFLVTNDGNVTLTGFTIVETAFSGSNGAPSASCPVSTLAPSASTTCTATYTVSQADIDAGQVTNTAHVVGSDPKGVEISSPNSSATVTATRSPALSLVKSVSPATVTAPGDVVYTYLVTNDGNVTLTGFTVDETTFSGSNGAPAVVCPVSILAPHISTNCTATYTVSPADIDAGAVYNTATVSGKGPSGVPVVSAPSSATVTATQSPALSLTKSVAPLTPLVLGEKLTYTFAVQNTGNVKVTSLAVGETAFSGDSSKLSAITCVASTLAPGAQTTCTGTYTVQQADIDAGDLTNTAKATGRDPFNAAVTSNPSDAQAPAVEAPSIGLVKSHQPLAAAQKGAAVVFQFVVTNLGNTTVHGAGVSDSGLPGLPPVACPGTGFTWPGAPGVLLPGQTVTCDTTYVLTQADVDAGSISNTAEATALGPQGATLTANDTDTVELPPAPALSLTKSVAPLTPLVLNGTLTYTFAVQNTGNVTLHGLSLSESAFSGDSSKLSAITCVDTVLAPGAQTTCTGTYTVQQADIDAGQVTNTALANAVTPSGIGVASNPSSAAAPAIVAPLIRLTKSHQPLAAVQKDATVVFQFVVENYGNVTVTDVAVVDSGLPGLPPVACPGAGFTWPGAAGVLIPGQTVTCDASYVLTQADVDAGAITNTAEATAMGPSGTGLTAYSTDIVSLPATPALTLGESVAPPTITGQGRAVYSFPVTNTGNVTLSGIIVRDTAFSGSGTPPTISCPPTSLAPGETLICTASYSATAVDITAGLVTNTAIATGIAARTNAVVQSNTTSGRFVLMKSNNGTVGATGGSLAGFPVWNWIVAGGLLVVAAGLLVVWWWRRRRR